MVRGVPSLPQAWPPRGTLTRSLRHSVSRALIRSLLPGFVSWAGTNCCKPSGLKQRLFIVAGACGQGGPGAPWLVLAQGLP